MNANRSASSHLWMPICFAQSSSNSNEMGSRFELIIYVCNLYYKITYRYVYKSYAIILRDCSQFTEKVPDYGNFIRSSFLKKKKNSEKVFHRRALRNPNNETKKKSINPQ